MKTLSHLKKQFAATKDCASLRGSHAHFDCQSTTTKQVDASELPEGVDAERVWTVRVTSSAIDREGDRIFSVGMDTEEYAARGALIFGHNTNKLENGLAKPVKVVNHGDAIDVTFEFLPKGQNPQADMAWDMIQFGLLKCTSVGILVKDVEFAGDREEDYFWPVNVTRSELLEVSAVFVPANPEANDDAVKDVEPEPSLIETEVLERSSPITAIEAGGGVKQYSVQERAAAFLFGVKLD